MAALTLPAHARRAAGLGATMAALTAAGLGILVSAATAWWGPADTAPTFVEQAIVSAPIGLLIGAIAGFVIFGVIGLIVAIIGVKRVGWTFVYAVFGFVLSALAAYFFQPMIEGNTAFMGVAGIWSATTLAAFAGGLSGILVAIGLKAGPDI